MSYISQILSREILDSRGNPTVEVDVILEDLIKIGFKILHDQANAA